jgi:hypothetical protein
MNFLLAQGNCANILNILRQKKFKPKILKKLRVNLLYEKAASKILAKLTPVFLNQRNAFSFEVFLPMIKIFDKLNEMN